MMTEPSRMMLRKCSSRTAQSRISTLNGRSDSEKAAFIPAKTAMSSGCSVMMAKSRSEWRRAWPVTLEPKARISGPGTNFSSMPRTISRWFGRTSIGHMIPTLQLPQEDEDVFSEAVQDAQDLFGLGLVIGMGRDIANFAVEEKAFRIDDKAGAGRLPNQIFIGHLGHFGRNGRDRAIWRRIILTVNS